MDVRALIHDPERVHAALLELEDESVITTTGCKIHVPMSFEDSGLAVIGVENHIVGVYAIMVEDQYYGVSTVNAMIPIDPTATERIKIGDTDYYEFTFAPGSTVFKSTQLVKIDTIPYNIYDEIISKAHIPWYLDYVQMGKILDTAYYHGGANVGQNREVTHLLISMIARNPDDRTKYYRTMIETPQDLRTKPIAWIPMRSVQYAATNTLNKLAGSYFSEGVVAALVNPAERTERIEEILRL